MFVEMGDLCRVGDFATEGVAHAKASITRPV